MNTSNQPEINTDQFRFAHGKRPAGRGWWMFQVTWTDGEVTTHEYHGLYGYAASQLRGEIRLSGKGTRQVIALP